MLDSKRARAWVIAGVGIAFFAAGWATWLLGERAIERERDELRVAAEATLGHLDGDEPAELVVEDGMAAWTEQPSPIEDLLVLDGRVPRRVSLERPGFEAHYEIEAWGRTAWMTVRVDADGLTITDG